MKNYGKPVMVLVLSALLIAMGAGCAGSQQADSQSGEEKVFNIGIVQYVEHVALDAAREGFVAALKDNGYVDGENIKIDLQNAAADQSNLSTISDRFVSNNEDLVLAIATPATQAIAGKTTEIPILGTAVTDYVSA
ncbi:MAG TPA: ABC transporter substrate binding protein, partial [Anaerovoracaceae bacterium]|nr:ABC transporter substrate binding protein [Anaerovoracaceae bacterium]